MEDELRKEQVKWLSYERRALGMKTAAEKIEVAKEVIAMPPFSRAQSQFEQLWAERHGTPDAARENSTEPETP